MSYTVKYHEGSYPLSSQVIVGKCDACERKEKVQELPAEHNAGEIYTAKLCKACLLRLVGELEFPTRNYSQVVESALHFGKGATE